MRLVLLQTGLVCALGLPTLATAQFPGDATEQPTQQQQEPSQDQRLHLKYGVFDPLLGAPLVPEYLLATVNDNLFIVQYPYAFTDADRHALRAAGAKLHSPLPHNALIVRMDAAQAATAQALPGVRWVGPYQPAYRLEAELLTDLAAGTPMPVREYNMVMADKHNDKNVLQRKIEALGGKVTDRHDGGLLFTAELNAQQLVQAAHLDEVLWIDRNTPQELDMNNARIVQGSNYVETQINATGAGVRGHVYEGVQANHPDFVFTMTNVRSGGQAQSHGHCTAGIIFGDGTSHPSARGHAPSARGYYTNYLTVTSGWSRNQVIGDVVNVHNCMFTTASWGDARTTQYTADSADADDIIFDHRIPWTQSQSNAGNRNSRPQAWAKNIISVGGMYHYNNSNPGDDRWNSGASIGPAADGRIKPDLCNFYDQVWTSDRTGTDGYNTTPGVAGNYYTGFNGTSAATPVTAGLNALAIEMYTEYRFCNEPRVSGGSRFDNRPYAQTLKALQIANASLYPWGTGAGQAIRNYQGWGYGNVRTMYDNRNRMMIIPEDRPITQGATHTYYIDVAAGTPMLKICMTYLDPAGPVSPAISRINNLNMQVRRPSGLLYWGNNGLKTGNTSLVGGGSDTRDTVEMFVQPNPQAGQWRIQITAPTISQDAHLATTATDATYALVAAGGKRSYAGCARYVGDENGTTGINNFIPFGTANPSTLTTLFAQNNQGSVGGAVYFDIVPTASSHLYLHGISVNTPTVSGPITADIYRRSGTYVGATGSKTGWTLWTTAKGTATGVNNPSLLEFNSGIYLQSGSTHGIAVVARDFGHHYTNGANSYNNADLTVTLGAASNAPFDGSPFSPRTANIELIYQRDSGTWSNQKYQTILRCQELGGAGAITGLAFNPDTTGVHYNRVLRIRMTHKPAGYALSTNFTTNISGATTVLNQLDHSWEIRANQWNEVGLQFPFTYNGTSDVVVEVMARGNHTSRGSVGTFHRESDIPRAYACGWPWSSEPNTTTGGTLVEGIDMAGTKIRAEFDCANIGDFGTSCGAAFADAVGAPVAGSSYDFHIHGAPANAGAFVVLGFDVTQTPLSPIGFDGCYAWVDNIASVFKLTSASGFASHTVAVPNTTVYDGLIINGYWAALDSNASGGLTFTNYVRSILGQTTP